MHLVHLPWQGDYGPGARGSDHSDEVGEDEGISVEALVEALRRRQRRTDQLLLTLAARVLAAECMLRAMGVRMDYIEERLRELPSLIDKF